MADQTAEESSKPSNGGRLPSIPSFSLKPRTSPGGLSQSPESTLPKPAAFLTERGRLGPKVTLKGQASRIRLPFPRPAEDRKDVKNLIVQMTKEAAAAKAKHEPPSANGTTSTDA